MDAIKADADCFSPTLSSDSRDARQNEHLNVAHGADANHLPAAQCTDRERKYDDDCRDVDSDDPVDIEALSADFAVDCLGERSVNSDAECQLQKEISPPQSFRSVPMQQKLNDEMASLLEAQRAEIKKEIREEFDVLKEGIKERKEADRAMWEKIDFLTKELKRERDSPQRHTTSEGVPLSVTASLDEEIEFVPLQTETSPDKERESVPLQTEAADGDAPVSSRQHIFDRFLSKIRGDFPSFTETNTGTISMYAVAVTVNSDKHIIWKFLYSLIPIVLIILQVFVLHMVIRGAAFPNCSAMSDCPLGTFCSIDSGNQPSCAGCSATAAFPFNSTEADEICPSLFEEGKWEAWRDIEIDYIEFKVSYGMDKTQQNCVAIKHCMESDINPEHHFEGQCDFIYLNIDKVDPAIWVIFLFLSLLWAHPICQDIEEAATEQKVLDHHLKGSLNIPAEMVRLAIRIRIYFLPAYVASTTLILLVLDTITAQSILLDFLSITFISEADNLIAALFLRTNQITLMNKAAKDVETKAFFATLARIKAIMCIIILIFGLVFVGKIKGCEKITEVIGIYVPMAYFLFFTIGGAIYMSLKKRSSERRCVKILNILISFFFNTMAFGLVYFLVFVLELVLGGEDKLAEDAVKLFGIATIVSIFILLALKKCKNEYRPQD